MISVLASRKLHTTSTEYFFLQRFCLHGFSPPSPPAVWLLEKKCGENICLYFCPLPSQTEVSVRPTFIKQKKKKQPENKYRTLPRFLVRGLVLNVLHGELKQTLGGNDRG